MKLHPLEREPLVSRLEAGPEDARAEPAARLRWMAQTLFLVRMF